MTALSLLLPLSALFACTPTEPDPVDNDGDGYTVEEDCDDNDDAIYPGAFEACDGVDSDCDGVVDDDLMSTFWADTDGDGFGDPASETLACAADADWVANAQDCDDTVDTVHPDGIEVCDGVDNNCDSEIDEDAATDAATWYRDSDEDGYGDVNDAVVSCEAPAGYISDGSDCDDVHALANPGGEEVCDNLDNDCDGDVDWAHRVPTDFATLQDAVDGVDADSTVCLEAGEHAGLTVFGGKSLTVIGTEGADNTVLNGESAGAVLSAMDGETLTLSGVQITGGLSDAGAALYLDASSAVLSDVDVWGNACLETAAACYAVITGLNGAHLDLRDAAVVDNTATSTSGRVYGAGLRFEESSLVLDNVEVDRNIATTDEHVYGVGVSVYGEAATLGIQDCSASENVGSAGLDTYGAGVMVHGGVTAVIDGLTADANDATGDDDVLGVGGYFRTSIATVSNSSFDANASLAADQNIGGGAVFWDTDATVSDASFNSNQVEGLDGIYGGGLYARGLLTSGFAVTYTSIDVSDNTSTSGAEADSSLYSFQTTATWTGVLVENNTVTADGPVLAAGIGEEDQGSTWANVRVSGNSASTSAGYAGGGLWSRSATSTWTNLMVLNNMAESANIGAAGFTADGSAVLTIANATIAYNTNSGSPALWYAAGLLNYSSDIDIQDSDISYNGVGDSTSRAGAVYSTSDYWDAYTNLYGNGGAATVVGFSFDESSVNLIQEPLYTDVSAALASDWDMSLQSTSALIDAGDPSLTDADGSTMDIGAYGGPGGADW